MAVTFVTVTGTEKDPHNVVAKGTIEFTLLSPLIDTAANVIYEPVVRSVTLDGSGQFSISLLASDNVGQSPPLVGYKVVKRIDGLVKHAGDSFFTLPRSASPTIDLADIQTVPVPPAAFPSILIFAGHGVPNSVVSAPPGALYLNLDGNGTLLSGITTLYVKESGGAGNSGWTAK